MIRNNHVAGGGDDDHDDDDDDDEPCSQWYLKSEQHLPFFFSKHENCCGVTPKAIHAGIPGADRTGMSQEKQALWSSTNILLIVFSGH